MLEIIMVPNLLRQVVNVEWLLIIGIGLAITNVWGLLKIIKIAKGILHSIDIYFAEHEILMYAKASHDGCSRQYLRDTAVAAAAELARRPPSGGKARGRSNGLA